MTFEHKRAMRSRSIVALSFFFAATSLGACAAPQGDDAEGQESNVTGGSSAIESPVVYLFDGAAAAGAPKCAGAMLGDKVAVTAKACAKEGMLVGRATEKDGRGTRAKITKVYVPEDAGADIAVVDLDKALGGTNAVITHMPLRAGYAVNGVADADGKGLFSPDEGEASSVSGSILEEDATHGVIVPKQGSEICDGDLGAPVCSSTGAKIGSFNVMGTCGLSGLVVGRAAPAPQAATGEDASACSGGAWKVAQLGRYADFLKQHAPKAFEPLRIDKPVLRNLAYAPEGLWGYKTNGDVAACTITTATLSPIAAKTASAKLGAKVSFANMDKKAAAWGRFGIAKKSDPKAMRWLPAKAIAPTKGTSFETSFEGIVTAEEEGDYLVAFRASANGGESWIECDVDGIENGFSSDKTVALRVGLADAPPETPPSEETTPQDTSPSTDPGYSDPPSDSSSSSSGETLGSGDEGDEDDDVPAKKKASESGCSVGRAGGAGGSSALGLAGTLLALAFGARRRRK